MWWRSVDGLWVVYRVGEVREERGRSDGRVGEMDERGTVCEDGLWAAGTVCGRLRWRSEVGERGQSVDASVGLWLGGRQVK